MIILSTIPNKEAESLADGAKGTAQECGATTPTRASEECQAEAVAQGESKSRRKAECTFSRGQGWEFSQNIGQY